MWTRVTAGSTAETSIFNVNRRMRNRTSGGVGGRGPRGPLLPDRHCLVLSEVDSDIAFHCVARLNIRFDFHKLHLLFESRSPPFRQRVAVYFLVVEPISIGTLPAFTFVIIFTIVFSFL